MVGRSTGRGRGVDRRLLLRRREDVCVMTTAMAATEPGGIGVMIIITVRRPPRVEISGRMGTVAAGGFWVSARRAISERRRTATEEEGESR